MADPEILNVPPTEATEFFRAKGHHVGFDWRDTDAEQHFRSFTVAKAMREDVLRDIRTSVDRAIAEGITFRDFHGELEPLLRKRGWWGRQKMVDPLTGKVRNVQLGNLHRLRVIFDTNLRTAYAKGRWDRIERTAKFAPYLRYVATLDARTRPQHRMWHGTILPWDHPFWKSHYPPCGWRCRCTVIQLSEDDLKEFGWRVSKSPPPGWNQTRPWLNKRTGKVHQVPVGIDPGFQHNVGLVGRTPSVRQADPWAISEISHNDATHEQLGSARGSNPGGTYLGSDGVTRYVKFYDDPAQAYGEAVANRAYRELNIDAPFSALVRRDGKIVGVANEIVENSGTLGTGRRLTKGRAQQVLRGYSADVWLANWDAVGTGLDNVVATGKGRSGIARIDQGGSLLFRAQAGRKSRVVLGKITEWEGFADPSVNRHYARVFEKADFPGADELGRRALLQISAIRKLGKRTNDFSDLAAGVQGIDAADRRAILEMLRTRAKLLETEIAPRIRAALRASNDLPEYEVAFVKEMGRHYSGLRRSAIRTAGAAKRHGMNDPELTGVYAYTTTNVRWGHKPLNLALYSGDRLRMAGVEDQKLTTNAALAKLPDHVGVVRRGITLPDDILALHQPGSTVTYEGFTSATTGRPFSGPHQFTIMSKHGKSIGQFSKYTGEREVLFAAGSKFRVLEREDRDGYVYISMKEID